MKLWNRTGKQFMVRQIAPFGSVVQPGCSEWGSFTGFLIRFFWKKEGAACIFPAIPFSRPVGFPCPVCPGMETRRAVPSFPHRFPIRRGW